MKRLGIGFRPIGILIIIGGILLLIATILHPPLVDPYDGRTAFHGFKHSGVWMGDHILMLIATTLWLLGLAGSESFICERNQATRMGACLFYISLSLWILILATELTALPLLGEEIFRTNDSDLFTVWGSLFSLGLLAGYFAVACSWIGIAFYGWGMKKGQTKNSKVFENTAFYAGLIGLLGILLICVSFKWAFVLIPLTSGPAFLWTMWLGWKMMKAHNP